MTKAQILKKGNFKSVQKCKTVCDGYADSLQHIGNGAGERHRWHGIWYRNQNVQ